MLALQEEFKPFRAVNAVLMQRLWTFLQARVSKLRFASEMGHPALDGVVDALEEHFEQELAEPRHRQLVGAMIRRLMHNEGYLLEKEAVRVRLGKLFTVAGFYRHVGRDPAPSSAEAPQRKRPVALETANSRLTLDVPYTETPPEVIVFRGKGYRRKLPTPGLIDISGIARYEEFTTDVFVADAW